MVFQFSFLSPLILSHHVITNYMYQLNPLKKKLSILYKDSVYTALDTLCTSVTHNQSVDVA